MMMPLAVPEVLTWAYHVVAPVVSAVVFGVLGIALMALGFKVFDWLTPKMDIQKELAEKHNIAVAVVIGAVILGVAVVVHAAMTP